jgi:hypothetical protein
MSAEPQSNDGSNAVNQNGQTVAVLPTGIAGNPTYIREMDEFADRIVTELQNIANVKSKPITEVVVRGSRDIAEALEEAMGANGPEVDSYALDFRMFLDDEGEEGDDFEVVGVKQDGEDPMVSLVAQHHEMTADEIEEFDLKNREDRELVNGDVLSDLETDEDGEYDPEAASRITRAKAKSKGKATERIINEYHDTGMTADHAIILEDSTDNYKPAAEAVRGENDWVKYPEEVEGIIRNIQFGGGEHGELSWTLAMLHQGNLEADELTDDQVARLNEHYEADMLENVGVDVEESTSEPEPAPEPSAGAMRPDEEGQAVAGASAD